MIVVAIIAVLARIAMPKFGELMTRSQEAKVKNMLGTMRGAVNIYYSDLNFYPADLPVALTTDNKYLDKIPTVTIPSFAATGNPGHLEASGVKNVADADDDTVGGVWAYVDTGSDLGRVLINCTHNDTRAEIWSSK